MGLFTFNPLSWLGLDLGERSGLKTFQSQVAQDVNQIHGTVSRFTDPVFLSSIHGSGSQYAADTGAANAYVVTLPSNPASYISGMLVSFTPANTNTGASTINVNALGAKSIVTRGNVALGGGELAKAQTALLLYDGTSFRIMSRCAKFIAGTNPGNLTVNCAGYDAVMIYVAFTVSTSTGIVFQNLSSGVSVAICFNNGYSTAIAYSIAAIDPNGTNFNIFASFATSAAGQALLALQSGGAAAGQSLSSGVGVIYTGVTGATWLLLSG